MGEAPEEGAKAISTCGHPQDPDMWPVLAPAGSGVSTAPAEPGVAYDVAYSGLIKIYRKVKSMSKKIISTIASFTKEDLRC